MNTYMRIAIRFTRQVFRHRHRYRHVRPGHVVDGVTGGIFPLSHIFCDCGKEEPTGLALREAIMRRGL